jgi:hypothetical protein
VQNANSRPIALLSQSTAMIDGTVNVSGAGGQSSGGGGGGGILVHAPTVSLSGTLSAIGGQDEHSATPASSAARAGQLGESVARGEKGVYNSYPRFIFKAAAFYK